MNAPTLDTWLWSQCHAAAAEAFKIQCADPHAALYLYYKRGAIVAAIDPPDADFELASGERISPANTQEQNARKFYTLARQLPCLPEEETKP
jgi:hypothetical protein